MAISVPFPGLIDIRQPILGDSFGWSGLEPTARKTSIVFHHSGSDAAAEDGFSIADYHVNHNGWGGIGYHFVITRSDYPGRGSFTPAGAQIQYVGDLGTYRAHVMNQNPGRVGICFVGLSPDKEQLRLGRQLVDFLMAPNNILPSINFYSQVTVHRLVPEQSTSCPGDNFNDWLPYLQGGAEPAAWNPPAPVVTEPLPEVAPGKGGGEPIPVVVTPSVPEWVSTWTPYDSPVIRTVWSDNDPVIDFTTSTTLRTLPIGADIETSGEFTVSGVKYYRSKWATENNKWNGIAAASFESPSVPVEVKPMPTVNVPVDMVQSDITDDDIREATVPVHIRVGLFAYLADLVVQWLSKFVKKKGSL